MKFQMSPIPISLMRLGMVDDRAEKNRIVDKVQASMRGEALVIVNMFKKTTATWNDKPRFEYRIENNGDTISVKVWTDDDIYYFVDQGTMVRYATMTSDPVYVPKTIPGWVGSRQGQGDVAFISRRSPRRGIESRRFTETIYENRRGPAIQYLSKIITDEVSDYFRKLWGGR